MDDSEVAQPRPARRRLLLTLLILGAVINYADRQIIAILKPLIGLDFHWSDAQYGRLASAFQLASAVGLLFAGWFVDRLGTQRANPLAVGVWSLIATAQAGARTLAAFSTLRVALGAAEAMGTPVLVKTVAILFGPSERSMAFGAMNAASTAGAIVTPLVIPALAAAWGWRSAFAIVGGTGLLWVAAWLMAARGTEVLGASTEPSPSASPLPPLPSPSPLPSQLASPPPSPLPLTSSTPSRSHSPSPSPSQLASPPPSPLPLTSPPPSRSHSPLPSPSSSPLPHPRPVQGRLLADRRTWAIAGAKLLSDQAWWFLLFWAPDILHRLQGLDLLQTSVPLAAIYACAAAGSLLGGFASRTLMRHGMALNRARKLTLLGCAILAIPVASVPALRGEWTTVAVLGLTLAAHQGFSVNLFALIADITPPSRVATVTGIGSFCGNLGGMGILAFTGWILTRRGDYGFVFALAAVSYLLALLWIQVWLPVLRVPDVDEDVGRRLRPGTGHVIR